MPTLTPAAEYGVRYSHEIHKEGMRLWNHAGTAGQGHNGTLGVFCENGGRDIFQTRCRLVSCNRD